jgi:CBS domain-containing protein
MKAVDIMTTNVVTIRGADTVAQAITLMKDKGLRALIVDRRYDGDAYGIVTEADIIYKVVAHGKDPRTVRVYEVMTKPCIVINPNLAIEYVARLFANTGIRRAPVIQDALLGIISITDILTKGNLVEDPSPVRLDQRIADAIADARNACNTHGSTSRECIVAWDTVEELQAEAAHQRAQKLTRTAFDEYCEEFPEAAEARMYDV